MLQRAPEEKVNKVTIISFDSSTSPSTTFCEVKKHGDTLEYLCVNFITEHSGKQILFGC